MSRVSLVSSTSETSDDSARRRLLRWLPALILALLLHALFFTRNFHWSPIGAPPRVEINTVDPQKLDAIRKQWRKSQQLLLNKDKSAPTAAAPPKDARYFSDRNQRVEKEERARIQNVIPKSGSPGPQAKAAPESKAQKQLKTHPDLSQIGIPFRLDQPPQKPLPIQHSGEEGGDQAIQDRALPEGNQNLLNTEESVYYSFYARLYEAIGPIWQSRVRDIPGSRRLREGEYTTTVDVVMDAHGTLLAVNQLQSSGVRELDLAVETSWKRLERFPNPPSGLLNPKGEVHTGWTFTVQVGPNALPQYLPPERKY